MAEYSHKADATSSPSVGRKHSTERKIFAVGADDLTDVPDECREASEEQEAGQSGNGGEASSESSNGEEIPTDFAKLLSDDAIQAYANLVVIVLRHDFAEPYNVAFRKTVLEAVAVRLSLLASVTKKLQESLDSAHVSDNSCVDDNLPWCITTIKRDAHILQHGCLTLSGDLVTTLIQTGSYDARSRVLIRHVSALLGVDFVEVQLVENSLACFLSDEAHEESEEEVQLRRKREKLRKFKRWAIIGGTGVVGGVLVGLTAGLAAPLFATGLGVIIGTGAAAGVATTAGAAVIGSLLGVAGAGLAGYKVNKRVGEMEEFTIETLCSGKSLSVVVAVSGWIGDDREDCFRWPWRNLCSSEEQYSLKYESKYLLELGKAVEYLMSYAVSYGIQQTLMQTALSSLMAAIAWPMTILSIANVIDNPWSNCVGRSVEVGTHLAQLLISRKQGNRPVTLLGFSLGARVVYHCLLEMSKRKDCDGIIEDVVLMGAPITGSREQWNKVARVVGGRIINAYSTTDWLLKFLYRTMNLQLSIAGTAPIEADTPKIMNVNVTHIIKGHTDYLHNLTEVLAACGVRVNKSASSSEATTPSTPNSSSNRRSKVMTAFPPLAASSSNNLASSSSNASSRSGSFTDVNGASTNGQLSSKLARLSTASTPSVIAEQSGFARECLNGSGDVRAATVSATNGLHADAIESKAVENA